MGVKEAKDTSMEGVHCLGALLLAQTPDFVELNRRQKRAKKKNDKSEKSRVKKYIFSKMDGTSFFMNKKVLKIKYN